MPSHSKPIAKGTTFERKNTPMLLIDLVTKTRFSVQAILHELSLLTLFFFNLSHVQTFLLLELLETSFRMFRDLQIRCRGVFIFKPGSAFELSQIWILEISRMMLHTNSSVTKVTPKRKASPRACGSVLLVVRRSHRGGTGIKRMVLSYELHSACFNAVWCHKRLLKTTTDEEVDKQLLENDEEEWKSVVRGLVVDGELRSEAARRAARAQIENR